RSYTAVHPSLYLAYDLTDDVKLRFGYGKTMQPLDLLNWGGAKSVGRVFNEECNCMRISSGSLSGNPQLDPTRGENIDLSAEWYLGEASSLSAALFHIEIDSFVTGGSVWVNEADADGIFRGPFRSVGRVFNEECNCMRISSGSLSGNPQLDPTRGENIDLSAEWYLGEASSLSAALFHIEIDSFVTGGSVWVNEADADGIFRGPY